MAASIRLKTLGLINKTFSRLYVFESNQLTHRHLYLRSSFATSKSCVQKITFNSRQKRNEGYRFIGAKPLGLPCLLAILGFKKSEKAKPEDDIINLIKHAKLAEHKKDAEKADEMYHRALAMVVQHQNAKDMADGELLAARTHIYDNMANLALSRGQFEKAESLFKETMRGQLEKGVAETDNSVVEISLKLAMVYAMQRKNKDAENGYNFCINVQEAKLKEEEEIDTDTVGLLGMCTNSYSRYLMVAGRLPEAEIQMKRCIELGFQAFGPNHPQMAILLNDLATLESMQKKHDEAILTLNKAIYIGQNTASADLPIFHCNQGNVYSHKGDKTNAKRSCEIALRLAQDNGDKHTEEKAKYCIEQSKAK